MMNEKVLNTIEHLAIALKLQLLALQKLDEQSQFESISARLPVSVAMLARLEEVCQQIIHDEF